MRPSPSRAAKPRGISCRSSACSSSFAYRHAWPGRRGLRRRRRFVGVDRRRRLEPSPPRTARRTQLETVAADTLTIATDDPAFPPYFEDNDPTNGEGFESAVAYAVAEELGFTEDQVEWVVEPFNRSYAPGEKDYDFDINQISITPKRAEAVDFSSPVLRGEAGRRCAEGLAHRRRHLARRRRGRRHRRADRHHQPRRDRGRDPAFGRPAQVFDTSNDVVSALKNGQVEAVVVDVPTAFFLTAVQVTDAADRRPVRRARGRRVRPAPREGLAAHRLRVAAVDALSESGELAEIEEEWLSAATDAPILE